jgi:hypothetical protein
VSNLLLIVANAQITDALDGMLDVRLLVGLDVDVAFQALLGHHRLDLERLQGKKTLLPNNQIIPFFITIKKIV